MSKKNKSKNWVRADYEKFVAKITKNWPEWKKQYARTRFLPEGKKGNGT